MFLILTLVTLIGHSQALYGGREIDIREAPHQVSIWERRHHNCGGSIVSENWVLTLSNCVDAFIENFEVHAGATRKSNGSVHAVVEVHYHIQGFGGKASSNRELALLRVDPPIVLDAIRQPVKLADSDFHLKPKVSLSTSGYGHTDGFVNTENLRYTEVSSMLLEDCVKKYSWRFPGSLYPGLLCTESSSACSGDAGNPVLLKNEGILVAVTTSSNGCGDEDRPDLHVMVARARKWIKMISGV